MPKLKSTPIDSTKTELTYQDEAMIPVGDLIRMLNRLSYTEVVKDCFETPRSYKSRLTPNEKSIFLALFELADENWQVQYCNRQISKVSGCSLPTVEKAIKALQLKFHQLGGKSLVLKDDRAIDGRRKRFSGYIKLNPWFLFSWINFSDSFNSPIKDGLRSLIQNPKKSHLKPQG